MADVYRLMIRPSPELYAQLAARGSQGQPLAAIVRQALIDYFARQPQQPDDIPARLTALTTSLQELHDHIRALTSVAERSLPLLNLVEILYQPRAQLLLYRGK